MEYPERVFKRKIYEKLVEWKRTKDGDLWFLPVYLTQFI